ncbi:MAG: tetratricopeptide repeat protein [Propionibacteriaceae bacterium]|nr:tetratricopeptide repeat protein [Propionibacteriaceae bacterium]
MSPARPGDDAGTYVDVSAWTADPDNDNAADDAPEPETAASDPDTVAPARRRARKPWLFAVLGVVVGLGIVWGVWSAGATPTSAMPAGHPPTDAPAAAPATVEPLTDDQMAELKAKVDANPDSLDDRLIYGVALYNKGEYGPAEEQWLAAAEVAPEDPGPWYNLGFLYLSLDPPADDKAEEAWSKVVELAPGTDMATTVSQHLDRLDTMLPGAASPTPKQ